MEKDYDPNLFYAKATFNFNEDGKTSLYIGLSHDRLFKPIGIALATCRWFNAVKSWRQGPNV